jgi:hypothetical protein
MELICSLMVNSHCNIYHVVYVKFMMLVNYYKILYLKKKNRICLHGFEKICVSVICNLEGTL